MTADATDRPYVLPWESLDSLPVSGRTFVVDILADSADSEVKLKKSG